MTVLDAGTSSVAGGVEPRARSVSFIGFNLRLTEPGGVTVPGKTGALQVELDKDLAGNPHLPGTSLAGALRGLVRGERSEDTAADWFGSVLSGTDAEPKASRVWVLGSRRLDDADIRILSSTKIDRRRGAAAGNTLRTEEVLPVGARFEVFLRWDDAGSGEVAELAALIADWQPVIGRGVSRGRGRCAVETVRHGTLRLDDADDLLCWLTFHGPDLVRKVLRTRGADSRPSSPVEPADGAPPGLLFAVPVEITGPWRIGTGYKPKPGSREKIPLLRAWPDGPPSVPGTAVKGLLRSRAEFILRSVCLAPKPCEGGTCGKCWTCEVFGYGGGDDPESGSVGRRAAIRFADATVGGEAACSERTHIAIDRFTGGVLDGALYTDEVLESGTFTIEADLLSGSVGETRRAEIASVVRLVLEDLNDGIIAMGSGTARGYGSVRADLGTAYGLPDLATARRTLGGMVRGGGDDSR